MPSRTLASASRARRSTQTLPAPSFAMPWQAAALLATLTFGAAIHAFPQSIQPFAEYGKGLVQAARAWHQAPPANSPEYLGQ